MNDASRALRFSRLDYRYLVIFLIWLGGIAYFQANVHNWHLLTGLYIAIAMMTILIERKFGAVSYVALISMLYMAIKPLIIESSPIIDSTAYAMLSIWPQTLKFQLTSFSIIISILALFQIFRIDIRRSTSSFSPGIGTLWIAFIIINLSKVLFILGFGPESLIQIAGLSSVLLGLATYTYRMRRRRIILVIMVFTLVIDAIWGSATKTKLPIILDFLGIAFVGLRDRRLKFKDIFVVIGSAILVILFIGFVTKARYSDRLLTMSYFEAGIYDLIGRSDTFNTSVRIVYYTPNRIPFWGDRMLKATIQNVIMPLPFPGKEKVEVGLMVSEMYYGYRKRVYLAISVPMSWYVTYGAYWSYLALCFHFSILAAMLRYCVAYQTWISTAVYLSIVIFGLNIEQSYYETINFAYKSTIFFAVLYLARRVVVK